MPGHPKTPCPVPGCDNLVTKVDPCPTHGKKKAWEIGRASSSARGYGHEWRKLAATIIARDPICMVCRLRPSVQADHIVPKSRGGTDDPSNLRGVCKQCHSTKSGREGASSRIT